MYAKIFRQIYDGTLAEDWQSLITFQQLLILADHYGQIDMTISTIHRITNIPIDIIQNGILKLEAPDPKSRRNVANGRRIERLDTGRDWGWRIVNHNYYRGLQSKEDKREKDRIRIAEKRNKNKDVAKKSQSVVNVAYTDTDTEYIYSRKFPEIWEQYPVKDGRKIAEKHFLASVKTEQDWKDINSALINYKAHLKIETWKKPKNGSTWFNNWKDWVNVEVKIVKAWNEA